MTRQRVSRDEPNRLMVLIVLIVVALLGNISLCVILSSMDFMYISFTAGLTYAISDVDVTSAIQRL